MTINKIDDGNDNPDSITSNPAPRHAKVIAAVGQMFWCDNVHSLVDQHHLRAPCHQLRDRPFGRHARTLEVLHWCQKSTGDYPRYLDEWCVEGSTAILIGPRHVLTCAHSIIRERISSHAFVFGRTGTDQAFRYEHGVFYAPRARVHLGRRLIGYVNAQAEADWAVVELFTKVDNIAPLRVANYYADRDSLVFGHPFGLPLKQATARSHAPAPDQPLTHALGVDNALGGSGSAVIQAGAVVGVLRGAVTSAAASISPEPPFCIDFAKGPHQPQPFTPAQRFAPTLPHIFGW